MGSVKEYYIVFIPESIIKCYTFEHNMFLEYAVTLESARAGNVFVLRDIVGTSVNVTIISAQFKMVAYVVVSQTAVNNKLKTQSRLNVSSI